MDDYNYSAHVHLRELFTPLNNELIHKREYRAYQGKGMFYALSPWSHFSENLQF
jgi:hypothetical protein